MKKFNLKKTFAIILIIFYPNFLYSAEQIDPIKVDWSFKGLTGKFDRASLQEVFKFTKRFVHLAIQCNI